MRTSGDRLLIRALMYRIATNEGIRRQGGTPRESVQDYRHVVKLVLDRI